MKILIIGLGSIGAGFDGPHEGENHAWLATQAGLDLVGGVDPDTSKRLEFSRRYRVKAFSSLELAVTLSPNVVVIATDAVNHKKLVESAFEFFPSAILICEKPFGSNYTESLEMVETALSKDLKLFVNYSRQFSIGFQYLLTKIHGKIQGGTVVYNYGISRSCSHFIRLCIGLFGEPLDVRVPKQHAGIHENPSFSLEYSGEVFIEFLGVQNLSTRIGDFNLITDTEVIQINQGINWELKRRALDRNPNWVGDLEEIARGNFSGGLANLYLNLYSNRTSLLRANIKHDTLPNKIIEKVLKNEK